MGRDKSNYKNSIRKKAKIISFIFFAFMIYSTIVLITDNFSGFNEYILKSIVSITISIILILVILILCLAIVNETKEIKNNKLNKLMTVYIILLIFFFLLTIPISKLGFNCILDLQYALNPKEATISNVQLKNLDSIKFEKEYIIFKDNSIEYKMNVTFKQSNYIYKQNNEFYTIKYLPNTSILISIK